jgi:hypothetical protein
MAVTMEAETALTLVIVLSNPISVRKVEYHLPVFLTAEGRHE